MRAFRRVLRCRDVGRASAAPGVEDPRKSDRAQLCGAREAPDERREEAGSLATVPHCIHHSLATRPARTHTSSPALPGVRQWTALDKELASEAVRKVEKLVRRCCCCAYFLLPLTTRQSPLPREVFTTLLRATTRHLLQLATHHSPLAPCRAQRGQEAHQGQGERRRGPHPAPVRYNLLSHAYSGG